MNLYNINYGTSFERVKVYLRPSNTKRLYTDEKSTEKGELNKKNRKIKGRNKGK